MENLAIQDPRQHVAANPQYLCAFSHRQSEGFETVPPDRTARMRWIAGGVLGIVSDRLEIGHLIPRFVIKHATRLFLEHAAPLLEEKRDAAS